MKTRLIWGCLLGPLLSSCSVLLSVEDCTSDQDCSPGQECAAGACIPTAPTTPDGGQADAGPPDSGADGGVVRLDPCQQPGTRIQVTNPINVNTIWRSACTYLLTDFVFVENAELEIEPGTTVFGDERSALIVTTTGTIRARGRADAPIVFTSSKPVGQRQRGDWGGVALLGRAPINVVDDESMEDPKPQEETERLEGISSQGDRAEYGGRNPLHSCGTLRYVRIEFAGFEDFLNNELNGLTVGGCGADTTLDYIQVHLGDDDGIEFFGGTAGITHAVITRSDDDGLDWDEGWQGFGQFIFIQADGDSDNGIEADNLFERVDGQPRSRPTLYNMTIIGSRDAAASGYGMVLRDGTAGDLGNVIVMGFRSGALDIRTSASSSCALALMNTCENQPLNIRGAVLTQLGPDGVTYVEAEDGLGDDNGLDEAAWLRQSPMPGQPVRALFVEEPNQVSPLGLVDPYSLSNPRIEPLGGSLVLTSSIAVLPPDLEQFERDRPFIGAVRTGEDWTFGWTAYPEN